jgi:hypothetical protein
MRHSLTFLSLLAFVLALAAWVLVWFLYTDVSNRLSDRTNALSSLSLQSAQQENAIGQHALVSDTAAQRSQLDAAVATDVVGIAGAITAAGNAAGTQTTIGSASVVASSEAASVNELEFVVQSTGSFQQIWRAAELFQSLPLPSTVSEIDLEQLPTSGKQTSQWQLTAHIDVLTSAQISS